MTSLSSKLNDGQGKRWLQVKRIFPVIAGLLILSAIYLPLWSVGMDAPQYPDQTLTVKIYASKMDGDIDEYNILNQYAGVRFPDYLPEFEIFPKLLAVFGIASILLGLLPQGISSRGLLMMLVLYTLFLVVGAVDLQYRLYVIGHDLDPNAPMVGIKPFTPPILGPNKVANFTTLSLVRSGGIALGLALMLILVAFLNRNTEIELFQWLEQQKNKLVNLINNQKKHEKGINGGY